VVNLTIISQTPWSQKNSAKGEILVCKFRLKSASICKSRPSPMWRIESGANANRFWANTVKEKKTVYMLRSDRQKAPARRKSCPRGFCLQVPARIGVIAQNPRFTEVGGSSRRVEVSP
jgi:hypothetical protein